MTHSELALKLFGEVTPDTLAAAKAINYMRMYSCGEIKVSLLAGMYPLKD